MTTVRVGPTQQYSDGWESAFGNSSRKSTARHAAAAKRSIRSAKKAGKKRKPMARSKK